MEMQKSPHTQSQQNTNFGQTDLAPDRLEQTLGTGEDAAMYANNEGAQTGAERSPRHRPSSAPPHNTEPAVAAYEGSVTSRVSDDPTRQGISSNSSQKELPGQKKVVSARDDARAGLNHSGKTPQEHKPKAR